MASRGLLAVSSAVGGGILIIPLLIYFTATTS